MGKKVLLLGSGRMTHSLVEYLTKREHSITIASNLLQEAEALAASYPNCSAVTLNLTPEDSSIYTMVEQHDITVSLVPAFLHSLVAKAAIAAKKPMVTASYIDDKMKELKPQIEEAGILILCECGLDPGIDHMLTAQLLRDAEAKGGKVLGYKSYCGAIPSAESNTNPLQYKISWEPTGAVSSFVRPAKFLENNEVVELPGDQLLVTAKPYNGAFTEPLECYPNGDSTKYREVYNIPHCRNAVRGTFRHAGFANVMRGVVRLGFFSHDTVDPATTWVDYIGRSCEPGESIRERMMATFVQEGLEPSKTFNEEEAQRVIYAIDWLGILDGAVTLNAETPFKALVALLSAKLVYTENEVDLCVMMNQLEVELPDGSIINPEATIHVVGEPHMTAISKYVGLPAAAAAQIMLEGNLNEKGLRIPTFENIFTPVIEALQQEGLTYKKSDS